MPGREVRLSSLSGAPGFTQLVKPSAPAAGAAFIRAVPADAWERILGIAYTYAADATGAIRLPLLTLMDADGYVFQQLPGGVEIQPSETWTVYGNQNAEGATVAAADSPAQGSVTSPGAAAVVAHTANLPLGRYQVQGNISLAGTVAAGDANNFQLLQGATQVAVLDIPAVTNTQVVFGPIDVDRTSGNQISVASILAGTAGAIYAASFTARPLSGFVGLFEIPDLLLRTGWQVQLSALGAGVGDQISGVSLLVERIPSEIATGHDPEQWQGHLLDVLAGLRVTG